MVYSFEKLEVWEKSRELVKEIYQLTQQFPNDERFGLTNQMRRAIVSVSSNIAEGSTRHSNKDKARFYEIAFGSLIEVLNQLILAEDLEYFPSEKLNSIRPKIEAAARMLNALHKSTHKLINQ